MELVKLAVVTYDWYENDLCVKRQHVWFDEELGPITGLVAWTKPFSMSAVASRPRDYRQTYVIWRDEPYEDWFHIQKDLPAHGFQPEWGQARHVDFGRV